MNGINNRPARVGAVTGELAEFCSIPKLCALCNWSCLCAGFDFEVVRAFLANGGQLLFS
jgi:hypothetical protein